MAQDHHDSRFVEWFRGSSPYIHAFRGRTFVVVFGGALIAEQRFTALAHDIALLNSLGIKLVLVHGSRPQIEQRLTERGAQIHYHQGRRITDDAALACVKEAAGSVRIEIEALLSMGVANTPMAGARIRVASGNYVAARPLGILDGVDHLYTGRIRRIDHAAIRRQLEEGAIVLLSPIGYSPTGEVFNLTALEVAAATAIALGADKYIHLTEAADAQESGAALRALAPAQAEAALAAGTLGDEAAEAMRKAVTACRAGVRRAHLIPRGIDGGLLLELFTRDGVGTMITTDSYEGTRQASIEDIGGILELITPLEQEGILVRRSREHLELEVDRYTVIERDGMIIACAALHPYPAERAAELACLAVHPHYRGTDYGDTLLRFVEDSAKAQHFTKLFAFTTQAIQWFQERGFQKTELEHIPVERHRTYNWQRRSAVLAKEL